MAYATIADMERRLPVLALVSLTGAAQGQPAYNAAIDEALTWASGRIDSYAGARYKLPLQTSEQVEKLTVDLAAYFLEQKQGTIRDGEQKAYDDAIAFLKDLARGLATLDQPSGEDPQQTSADVLQDEDPKIFSDENLSGF